ncbi:PREDICTED: putative pentatricopeptide repeat-containing protein At1g12700, mitochondrial [Erythranthe guttata]|uniref:putative pentatricopeptide repeat-containing protein At1g12700, mitochondrial n=1 Tax=Erythranthe guttata TaxID=4155 RepID=UPI00064E14CD|nr:PREDICTED: putative pentatricopeptide repeat-containing protein At1g12700, mitochondrial [Erythranthe guttata]|eukprot:XP_012845070.1 PREDICTED: putative pentatricopeptide repeat-containing protein At1g12700, mitochondrial [Erythranthe guttata]
MKGTKITLIRRAITTASSHHYGIFDDPFSLFCSNFHSVGPKDRSFSRKRRIDLSCINEVDDVVFLFRQMARMQPQPSVIEFTKLLQVVVEMKHYSGALKLFDEMRQWAARINEYTMTILINCCCLFKHVDIGFAIFGCFFKRCHEPNVTTFNTLLKELFLDGNVAEAEKLFKKIFTFKLCEPNDVTILTVVDGLCKTGHVLAANDLLWLLEKTIYKPNVKAYNAVIDGLCKTGTVDNALQLKSRKIDKGISPTIVTYNSMIQGLCDFCRWKEVKDLLNEVVDHEICLTVVTFSVLVDAFCKEGNVKEAEDILEIMKQQNICPNIVTYNSLINGYCLQGKMDDAKHSGRGD